jgi:hypothetical protein
MFFQTIPLSSAPFPTAIERILQNGFEIISFCPQERITADTKSDAKDSIRQSKVCSTTEPEITISQIIASLDQKLDLFMETQRNAIQNRFTGSINSSARKHQLSAIQMHSGEAKTIF